MKNSLLEVFNTARAQLQGGDTSASIGFSNDQLQQFFNVAYPELWQIMAQVQTPRVRRDFFHYLPAYTTYFDPQAIGITDFGEPEWMEERGGVTTVTISSTTDTTPIRVATSGGHGLSGSTMPVQIADVENTTAPWGMWYTTYLSPTLVSLNGSTAPGAAGSGGKLMYSSQFFTRMAAVRDMPFNSFVNSRLGVYQWQDSALKFLGATQPVQIHITYWASAVPPTNVNTELGIDDCMAFLSTRVASLAAESRGWYDMADRLARRALGPSMQADGSGGLLRTWLNVQVVNMQRTEFRKPPFRQNTAWNYPGDYIYGGHFDGGDGSSSGNNVNPQGYYIVPVTDGVAAPDLSLGNIQVITATQDTSISTPLNLQPGPFWLKLIQDSTGGWAFTFSSDFVGIDPTSFSGPGAPANSVTILQLAVEDDLEISYLGVTYGPV